ncbi:HGGxSTG domain-containing protein [Hyphomonas oceanitis]|uniref:HGGxSTG domain-containing protein n=1 Tax=Hyphomonas oceanitis TaxID=81033 RepID=UPI003AB96662
MAHQTTCGAKTRRGTSCQSFPMPNGRCRMHGGTSPGAPKGNRNAWKHGKYSSYATELGSLERRAREMLPFY